MYQRQGKYGLAETQWAQALVGQRHALGSDHPETMESAADLAVATTWRPVNSADVSSVLTENRIVLTIVELIDLGLVASLDRVQPYINDAQFPSWRAARQWLRVNVAVEHRAQAMP
jgi:hypothetical protein